MKKIGSLVSMMLLVFVSFSTYAQTADEIINTYIKNIGGVEKFKKLNRYQNGNDCQLPRYGNSG